MFLTITSRYPTNEVKALIALAADGYDLRDTAVKIKNSQHACRGRAYSVAPRHYSRNLPKGVKRLVTVCIGAPVHFEGRKKLLTNEFSRTRWVRITYAEYEAIVAANEQGETSIQTRSVGRNGGEHWMEKAVVTSTPYGGSKSPLIEYHSWQEAMVAVAAHEFHHIDQFQNKRPCAERFCEQAALKAIERYRAKLVSNEFHIKPEKVSKTSMDVKLAHAAKMLKASMTREKRAITLRKKWQDKVKYYTKRSALPPVAPKPRKPREKRQAPETLASWLKMHGGLTYELDCGEYHVSAPDGRRFSSAGVHGFYASSKEDLKATVLADELVACDDDCDCRV